MPQNSPAPPARMSETEAEELIHGICFKTGPPRLIGAELEWLVLDAERPGQPLAPERLTAAHDAARTLPLRSRLTVEPGGQLELSSEPADSLTGCVEALQADLTAVRGVLETQGLTLRGLGQDPRRPHRRLLTSPRYEAMETYFDRTGPAGRAMMRASAAVQVCVDAGTEEPGPLGHGRRWRLAHLLGAVLVAAFANSPGAEGPYAGWRCARQGIWEDIDTRRALAPPLDAEPRAAWTRQAMDTEVMCIRMDDGGPWLVPRGMTFRDWLRTGGPRPATAEDLDYHLTTLFPPVRPRGHLELRMIDAQPGDNGWLVPVAVVHALFDDPEAAETAYRVTKVLADAYGSAGRAPHNPLWRSAARLGLADPELRTAAAACFLAAVEALPRLGASALVQETVAEFTERHVLRGRCPADDQPLRQLTGKGARS
ncbi:MULTISPECIES: ergothioneine biosynthesis glutamate--cysteine ligase EgtA [unclassified Streptomyces]|uniref:ergothioneine biosynthesis glutamate--cysteine ligase EgtA n=1 Tax=unclassified Streptomyces TaxID=2593676 RepID=UPI001BE4FAD8|nr:MULTISPECIES: ergothioneine biosynthesis glutamate--cysteine ligase EgtA [unclassified Streptomyces]MBT2408946.1 ergothioneine biosynthesis glutamate--cysteine ligase EgtA [Streptomyces sp. ISL-21]MBT2456215.1 ergothioneine biosynthesis glutamate--cysteine ligase EgtA [Streptomyces sp. ISL-86]MBT2611568.1 ergothioneine biosynthesis glutamate--cysteine ligase EgtA [Streptomyces sp. ISL-87]